MKANGYQIVDKTTGETIARIMANHAMSLSDACRLMADEILSEKEDSFDPDYIINGKGYRQEDLDLEIWYID